MKVYLAHNYAARGWLKQVVPMFEAAGHEVTSRWITSVKDLPKDEADMDLEDIQRSDALVFFAEQFGHKPGKGKFFELGYALALDEEYVNECGKSRIRVIIVGKDDSCVFYSLFIQVDTIEDAIEYLGECELIT